MNVTARQPLDLSISGLSLNWLTTEHRCSCGKAITTWSEYQFFQYHNECVHCDHLNGDAKEVLKEANVTEEN